MLELIEKIIKYLILFLIGVLLFIVIHKVYKKCIDGFNVGSQLVSICDLDCENNYFDKFKVENGVLMQGSEINFDNITVMSATYADTDRFDLTNIVTKKNSANKCLKYYEEHNPIDYLVRKLVDILDLTSFSVSITGNENFKVIDVDKTYNTRIENTIDTSDFIYFSEKVAFILNIMNNNNDFQLLYMFDDECLTYYCSKVKINNMFMNFSHDLSYDLSYNSSITNYNLTLLYLYNLSSTILSTAEKTRLYNLISLRCLENIISSKFPIKAIYLLLYDTIPSYMYSPSYEILKQTNIQEYINTMYNDLNTTVTTGSNVDFITGDIGQKNTLIEIFLNCSKYETTSGTDLPIEIKKLYSVGGIICYPISFYYFLDLYKQNLDTSNIIFSVTQSSNLVPVDITDLFGIRLQKIKPDLITRCLDNILTHDLSSSIVVDLYGNKGEIEFTPAFNVSMEQVCFDFMENCIVDFNLAISMGFKCIMDTLIKPLPTLESTNNLCAVSLNQNILSDKELKDKLSKPLNMDYACIIFQLGGPSYFEYIKEKTIKENPIIFYNNSAMITIDDTIHDVYFDKIIQGKTDINVTVSQSNLISLPIPKKVYPVKSDDESAGFLAQLNLYQSPLSDAAAQAQREAESATQQANLNKAFRDNFRLSSLQQLPSRPVSPSDSRPVSPNGGGGASRPASPSLQPQPQPEPESAFSAASAFIGSVYNNMMGQATDPQGTQISMMSLPPTEYTDSEMALFNSFHTAATTSLDTFRVNVIGKQTEILNNFGIVTQTAVGKLDSINFQFTSFNPISGGGAISGFSSDYVTMKTFVERAIFEIGEDNLPSNFNRVNIDRIYSESQTNTLTDTLTDTPSQIPGTSIFDHQIYSDYIKQGTLDALVDNVRTKLNTFKDRCINLNDHIQLYQNKFSDLESIQTHIADGTINQNHYTTLARLFQSEFMVSENSGNTDVSTIDTQMSASTGDILQKLQQLQTEVQETDGNYANMVKEYRFLRAIVSEINSDAINNDNGLDMDDLLDIDFTLFEQNYNTDIPSFLNKFFELQNKNDFFKEQNNADEYMWKRYLSEYKYSFGGLGLSSGAHLSYAIRGFTDENATALDKAWITGRTILGMASVYTYDPSYTFPFPDSVRNQLHWAIPEDSVKKMYENSILSYTQSSIKDMVSKHIESSSVQTRFEVTGIRSLVNTLQQNTQINPAESPLNDQLVTLKQTQLPGIDYGFFGITESSQLSDLQSQVLATYTETTEQASDAALQARQDASLMVPGGGLRQGINSLVTEVELAGRALTRQGSRGLEMAKNYASKSKQPEVFRSLDDIMNEEMNGLSGIQTTSLFRILSYFYNLKRSTVPAEPGIQEPQPEPEYAHMSNIPFELQDRVRETRNREHQILLDINSRVDMGITINEKIQSNSGMRSYFTSPMKKFKLFKFQYNTRNYNFDTATDVVLDYDKYFPGGLNNIVDSDNLPLIYEEFINMVETDEYIDIATGKPIGISNIRQICYDHAQEKANTYKANMEYFSEIVSSYEETSYAEHFIQIGANLYNAYMIYSELKYYSNRIWQYINRPPPPPPPPTTPGSTACNNKCFTSGTNDCTSTDPSVNSCHSGPPNQPVSEILRMHLYQTRIEKRTRQSNKNPLLQEEYDVFINEPLQTGIDINTCCKEINNTNPYNNKCIYQENNIQKDCGCTFVDSRNRDDKDILQGMKTGNAIGNLYYNEASVTLIGGNNVIMNLNLNTSVNTYILEKFKEDKGVLCDNKQNYKNILCYESNKYMKGLGLNGCKWNGDPYSQ